MTRPALSVLLAALLVLACRAADPGVPSAPTESAPPSEAAAIGTAVPNCADVPLIEAAPDQYADEPIYAANEMPTEAVQRWAAGKPGFEGIWIDREHAGWITLAFSRDAAARQAELDEAFPEDGVVAVAVDWTSAELDALQLRVNEALTPLFPVTTGTLINYGVVSIGLGVLAADRLQAVEERFAGERVCVEGMDPALLPSAGPQPLAGDGWRLIADELTGAPYRTGIAWDEASLRGLWREAGLTAAPPDVDFGASVVVWFGAVYSGSCPDIRLDDVVVDAQARVVHPDISQLGAAQACTADANPRAWLVTLERDRLPAAPFSIQLRSAAEGAVVAEERTVVEADLRAPGAIAAPGQVHGDAGVPAPQYVESGSVIETGFPVQYRMSVHCGAEWLGELNGINWRTAVPAGTTDWLPAAWEPVVTEDSIVLDVVLEGAPDPTVTATANGHSIVYVPSREALPGCD